MLETAVQNSRKPGASAVSAVVGLATLVWSASNVFAQLREALNRAAAGALKPPPLGVAELSVTTPPGRALTVADEIVRLAKQLNAAATKGMAALCSGVTNWPRSQARPFSSSPMNPSRVISLG